MLPAERRNPEVIGRNRLSGLSQLNIDSRIVMGSLLGDIQHGAVGDQAVQPASIPSSVPRLGDSVAKFSNDHHRQS